MSNKPDIVMVLGGLFAVAIGAALLLSELSPFSASGRWVLPVALAVGGVVVIVAVRRGARENPSAASAAGAAPADVDSKLLAAAHAELSDIERRVSRAEASLPTSWPRTADPTDFEEEPEA